MSKHRVLAVGLENSEIQILKQDLDFEFLFVQYDMLPKIILVEGVLSVESPSIPDKYLPVDIVVFHGIFVDDYDFITLLALWKGPCLPNAIGMMDLRQRIPGLARALSISRFSGIKRGMVIGSEEYFAASDVIAKWGVWHCGEDKSRFKGNWKSSETSVIEEFITGEAVRIMLIDDKAWQIRLTGEDWLKSIHHADSRSMEIDEELLQDSRNIAAHFNLKMVGVDYMVSPNGGKYLLEVNHIPNVTVFPFINEAFLSFAKGWIRSNSKSLADQNF